MYVWGYECVCVCCPYLLGTGTKKTALIIFLPPQIKKSFVKRRKSWLLFLGYAKGESALNEYRNRNTLDWAQKERMQ